MRPRRWFHIPRCVGAIPLALAVLGLNRAHAQRADTTKAAPLVVYRVVPSSIDSSVHRFDEPHLVVFDSSAKPDAPLLVFLPGTGGRPANTTDFTTVAARQGYRVIGLAYVDEPAVQALCPRERDPDCAEKVRRKRIYGDDVTGLIGSTRGGAAAIWWQPVDASAPAEQLTNTPATDGAYEGVVSPDGKTLAFRMDTPKNARDIYVMPLDGDRVAKPFISSPADELMPRWSPDGQWIVYVSDESRQREVYVRCEIEARTSRTATASQSVPRLPR